MNYPGKNKKKRWHLKLRYYAYLALVLAVGCTVIVSRRATTSLDKSIHYEEEMRTALLGLPVEFKNDATPREFRSKIIWAYWDGDSLPMIVKLCLWAWKHLNPEWELRVLNNASAPMYVSNFADYFKVSESPARLTDFVRLSVVYEYGGVWTDATNLPILKLDDWLSPLLQNQAKGSTTHPAAVVMNLKSWNTLGPQCPVIESWFFAAWPQTSLLRTWKEENDKLLVQSVDEFLKKQKKHGVKFQGIAWPDYLTIHIAAQRAIQDDNALMQNAAILNAEDGPYREFIEHDWNHDKFCQDYLIPKLKLDANALHLLNETRFQDEIPGPIQQLIESFPSTFHKSDFFFKLSSGTRRACETALHDWWEFQ